jgi:hypothetical protein
LLAIISALAASNSLSAVGFLPTAGRAGTLEGLGVAAMGAADNTNILPHSRVN